MKSFLRTLTYAAVGFAITVAPLAAETTVNDITPEQQAAACLSVMTVAVARFAAFAERTDVNFATLVKLENGRAVWERRAAALKVDPKLLFTLASAAWGNHKDLVTVDAVNACLTAAPREENL